MAGGKSVQGAYLIVTALTRSVRDIVPKYGTGNLSPTVMYDHAPLYLLIS